MSDGVASHAISEDELEIGWRNTIDAFYRSLAVPIGLEGFGDGSDVNIWYCD